MKLLKCFALLCLLLPGITHAQQYGASYSEGLCSSERIVFDFGSGIDRPKVLKKALESIRDIKKVEILKGDKQVVITPAPLPDSAKTARIWSTDAAGIRSQAENAIFAHYALKFLNGSLLTKVGKETACSENHSPPIE